MKNLFTAFVAVFFMFTAFGCGDDVEPTSTEGVIDAQVDEDAGASDDNTEESDDSSNNNNSDAEHPAEAEEGEEG